MHTVPWPPAQPLERLDPFIAPLAPGVPELSEHLRRVIPQDTTLLLSGETGTGKSNLARQIHMLSRRAHEPFLVVDCGALCPTLIESEMFGHVQGAFTGADYDRPGKLAAAGRGTLLLDEINALPVAMQGKLLRAVDDRLFEPAGSDDSLPLEARIIAISSVSLDQAVAAGRFRADLFYRLNVVAFYLPTLRARRHAIAPLALQFLAEFAPHRHTQVTGIDSSALRALETYDWPGNIRELHNVIERAVALASGPQIQLSDLPHCLGPRPLSVPANVVGPNAPLGAPDASPANPCLSLAKSNEQVEFFTITQALRKHRNNRLRAAAELGISRMSLYKKLHKYGLMRVENLQST
jgi:transcriptional regulator with PAS, ATPase and Fis domain